MDLAAQATISLPVGSLDLDTPGDFELVEIGVSGRTWRRTVVDGPFMHGNVLIGAVMDTATLTIIVRTRGTNWVAAMNRTQELFDALAQHAYTITTVIAGRTDVHTCQPADIRLVSGDTISKYHAMAQMQEYLVTIPITPGGIA